MRRKNSIGRMPVALLLLLAGPAQVAAQSADAIAPAAPVAAPGPTAKTAGAKLSPAVVAKYRADPAALLAAYPNGGRAMATMAKALILADPSLIGPLMAAARNATPAQMSAIGAGVAQAATIIAAVNPEMAAQIQLAVTQSGPPGVAAAFAASSSAAPAASATIGTAGVTPAPTPSPSTTAGGSTAATAEPSPSPTTAATAFTTAGSSAAAPTGGLTSATTQSTSPSKSSL